MKGIGKIQGLNIKKKEPKIYNGEELMNLECPPQEYLIEGMLGNGLYILGGSPKVGKSWLALWMILCIAEGSEIWCNKTKQGKTLYLCLEDTDARIHSRVSDLAEQVSIEANFMFEAEKLGEGLENTLATFLVNNKDNVSLIIIDTLQKIRPSGPEYSYSSDYKELTILKELADKYHTCILLVHHLRKEKDSDPCNRIAGTVGLQGAADGVLILDETSRGSRRAKLICTSRDFEHRELELKRDDDNIWQVEDDTYEQKEKDEMFEKSVNKFCLQYESYEGTPTEWAELFSSYGFENYTSKKIAKLLRTEKQMIINLQFKFSERRSNGKTLIKLFTDSVGSAYNLGGAAVLPKMQISSTDEVKEIQ